MVAAMTGHEYRSREVGEHRLQVVLKDIEAAQTKEGGEVEGSKR
jgi:hypothetical protein